MPRKSLDPGAQPFEFKVGVGISHLGGMYVLGDPSMCPPHRFRYLQNVRLGDKDILSRPGMVEASDTGSGEKVNGITELPPARLPISVWIGPLSRFYATLLEDGLSSYRLTQWFAYTSLDLTFTNTRPIDWYPPREPYEGATAHVPLMTYFGPEMTAPLHNFSPELEPMGFDQIAPVSSVPFLETTFEQASGISQLFMGSYIAEPSTNWNDGTTDWRTMQWSVAHEILPTLPPHPAPGYPEYWLTERIAPMCADVIVRFNDIWIVAGNYRGDQNPSALGTDRAQSSTASNNTGQPVYEVTFDIENPYNPWEGLDSDPFYYSPDNDVLELRGGGLREVFRMPGDLTEIIPNRAAGGAPGTLIRSMRAWSERQDDPLTGEVQTGSVLYIGTNGGFPLIAGVPPNNWPHATQDAGAVYSYDGTTVKKEDISPSALGQMVMVEVLPDGGVIAVGRVGGAFRDPNTGTWTNVLWNPSYYTAGYDDVPAFVSNDYGFMWMDRIVFQGEAYFFGFDVRRLAREKEKGFWNGPPAIAGPWPVPTYIRPNPFAGGASKDEDFRQPRAWVLYKYARSTNTMVLVRSGDDIVTALGLVAPAPAPNLDWGPYVSGTSLASDGFRLYYGHYWAGLITKPWSSGVSQCVGAFDGSVFQDDFITQDDWLIPGGSANTLTHMIGSEDGVMCLFQEGGFLYYFTAGGGAPIWLHRGAVAGVGPIPSNSGELGRYRWGADEKLFFGPK